MANTKFLKADTATNGKLIMSADNVVWVSTGGSPYTSTNVYLANTLSTFDVMTITHAADTVSTGNDMIGFIQDSLIKVAGTKWSESVLDITEDSPKTISNIQVA